MRKLLVILSAALLMVGVASQAHAKALDWSGTMLIELGPLPQIKIVGSGVATVNNSSGSEHLNTLRIENGLSAVSQVVPVTDPEVTMTIPSVIITARLGTATLTGISGGAPIGQRVLPVPGLARICLFFQGCGAFLPLDLTQNNGNTGVGIGGFLLIGEGAAPFRISIEAQPWTLGTGMGLSQTKGNGTNFLMQTRTGFVHGPASNTSTTAARLGSGVIQLISPMQMVSIGVPGQNEKLALFNTLTIHFIPEPGLLLLLGSGVAGLVVIGRSRRK